MRADVCANRETAQRFVRHAHSILRLQRSIATDGARRWTAMDVTTPTVDPQETQRMAGRARRACSQHEGPDRAHFLIEQLIDEARRDGAYLPFSANTAYINTIPRDAQVRIPGDQDIEHRSARTRAGTRWRWSCARTSTPTSAATSRASRRRRRSTTSASTTSGTRRRSSTAATSSSSRAIRRRASTRARSCSGRLTEEQLDNYRQEVDGKGISSYPHPWLMPDFWQFPTVSMGLGPLMAIYQARFMKYLQDRGAREHRGPQGLGVHGRRRDGRARVDGRDRHGRRARSSTT